MNRRNLLRGVASTATGVLLPGAASWANTGYPDRPIKLIVPWSAGGSTDVLARTVGQTMGDVLGKPMIVDNRPGAAGRLGVDATVKSPLDTWVP
jgi:tripartite-type tricarboxylate transporter receptor subunit TctC